MKIYLFSEVPENLIQKEDFFLLTRCYKKDFILGIGIVEL